MGEKMTPTLDGKLRCLQSLLQQMGASVACKTVGEARDALLTAHLTQPAQAVDVFAPIPEAVDAPTDELWNAYNAFNDRFCGFNTQQALRDAINTVLASRKERTALHNANGKEG